MVDGTLFGLSCTKRKSKVLPGTLLSETFIFSSTACRSPEMENEWGGPEGSFLGVGKEDGRRAEEKMVLYGGKMGNRMRGPWEEPGMVWLKSSTWSW